MAALRLSFELLLINRFLSRSMTMTMLGDHSLRTSQGEELKSRGSKANLALHLEPKSRGSTRKTQTQTAIVDRSLWTL